MRNLMLSAVILFALLLLCVRREIVPTATALPSYAAAAITLPPS